MKDCKFKQFIIDVYNEWNKPERTFKKKDIFGEAIYKNFFGELFGTLQRHSFSDIKDVQDYIDSLNPNMLMLKSRKTNQEVEIYGFQLKDYDIDGDKLKLQLKNKTIVFEM